jgi:hypothetical protein
MICFELLIMVAESLPQNSIFFFALTCRECLMVLRYAKREIRTEILSIFHRTTTMQWIFENIHFTVPSMLADFPNYAAQAGNLEALLWLRAKHIPVTSRALSSAAKTGQLGIIQYLLSEGFLLNQKAVENAAQNGHIDLLQFFLTIRNCYYDDQAIILAAGAGHVDVVQFFVEKVWNKTLNQTESHYNTLKRCVIFATRHGHLKVLQYVAPLLIMVFPECTEEAAIHGHMDIFFWLVQFGFPISERCMKGALQNGHLEICQYLYFEDNQALHQFEVDIVAARGHVHILDWMLEIDAFPPVIHLRQRFQWIALRHSEPAVLLWCISRNIPLDPEVRKLATKFWPEKFSANK